MDTMRVSWYKFLYLLFMLAYFRQIFWLGLHFPHATSKNRNTLFVYCFLADIGGPYIITRHLRDQIQSLYCTKRKKSSEVSMNRGRGRLCWRYNFPKWITSCLGISHSKWFNNQCSFSYTESKHHFKTCITGFLG